MLSEEHASFNETIDVRGYFDCEKICLGRGIMCVGANVIVTEGSYNCSLANEMHGNIWTSGKFDKGEERYRWMSGLELPDTFPMWENGEPSNKDPVRTRFISTTRKQSRDEPTKPVPSLYNGEVKRQDPDAAASFPSFPSFHSALYQHGSHTMLKLPDTRPELDINGIWTETHDGRRFLLFTDEGDVDTMA
ncbi:hypothetical protein LSH36_166g03054 [Paralvinella palmiformis]|uniref:Uncharacterized protein n=1 Tax=Paralvinella palmiformis TaxID=53620 RepID=A0AAD9JTD5_9ANNE|nr:hypothetical protein LSH36_166g03054 [Paralvinella palmiformis]